MATDHPNITIRPNQVPVNTSIDVTVTPATGMDFSTVQMVAMVPPTGIQDLQFVPQSNGDLLVSFSAVGTLGTHALVILGADSVLIAAGVIRVTPH
jgi:hypothetical protein